MLWDFPAWNSNPNDRYQNQPWYIRRLRDFHLLRIPFLTIRIWLAQPFGEDEKLSFLDSWQLACGVADGWRQYWFFWEEKRENKNENS